MLLYADVISPFKIRNRHTGLGEREILSWGVIPDVRGLFLKQAGEHGLCFLCLPDASRELRQGRGFKLSVNSRQRPWKPEKQVSFFLITALSRRILNFCMGITVFSFPFISVGLQYRIIAFVLGNRCVHRLHPDHFQSSFPDFFVISKKCSATSWLVGDTCARCVQQHNSQ